MSWRKTFPAVTASIGLLLSACAGGGGSTAGSATVTTPPPPPPPPQPPPPPLTPAAPPPTAAAFTSWRNLALPGAYQLSSVGLSVTVAFNPPALPGFGPVTASEHNLLLNFNGAGDLLEAYRMDGQTVITTAVDSSWPYVSSETLSFNLGSGSLVVRQLSRQDGSDFQQRFFSYADPASTGLSYTTYGWWATADFFKPDWYEGYSAGALTANAAIPVSGSAQFTGALTGIGAGYPSPGQVAAPITIDVDFGARAARFSSTDFRDGAGTILAGTALSGVLTYGAQQNALSGQLVSLNFAGPATARFYGPGAEEIGGAFVLAPTTGPNNIRIVGGFGARR